MLYHIYRFSRLLALKLPLKAGYALAVFVADIFYMLAKTDKENLKHNLKIALGHNDKTLIKKHIKNVFRNFAKYLVDFFRFSKFDREYIMKYIEIKGKENLDKTMARGKGTIFLTAHIGNWELGGAVAASLGYPFYAIALNHQDKRINDFFLEQRACVDVKIIPIGAQIKNCFRVLQKNWLLAIVGDRDFTKHGIKADFFGRETILPRGPAVFSLKTGAAIIPTFAIRQKNDKIRLTFEEPLEYKVTGIEKEDVKEIMRRYIAVMERYIKAYPDQWYAFRKVWD